MNTTTLTIHEQRARAIAREGGAAPLVKSCARQGDLLLTRATGEVTNLGAGAPTPEGGILLVAGRHGEHRAVGCATLERRGEALLLHVGAEGVVVAHTDVPSGRHAPLRLGAGVWHVERQRELSLEGIVQRVAD